MQTIQNNTHSQPLGRRSSNERGGDGFNLAGDKVNVPEKNTQEALDYGNDI